MRRRISQRFISRMKLLLASLVLSRFRHHLARRGEIGLPDRFAGCAAFTGVGRKSRADGSIAPNGVFGEQGRGRGGAGKGAGCGETGVDAREHAVRAEERSRCDEAAGLELCASRGGQRHPHRGA